jgi:hypothetical protein
LDLPRTTPSLARVTGELAGRRAKREERMASAVTVGLVVAATAASGLLAGLNVDRLIVQMPAWEEVGALAWATYSREADLGSGLILYPLEAIGGAILTAAAAVAFYFDRAAPRFAAVPIYAAVVLAVGGLLATTQAAPIMLSLREIGDDPAALQRAFESFNRWGTVRAVFQVLAFGANLWALVSVSRSRTSSKLPASAPRAAARPR